MGAESTPRSGAGSEGQGVESPGVSIIEQQPPSPILVSEGSLADLSQSVSKPHGAGGRSVRIQAPEKTDQDSGVQELFFNNGARSNASDFGRSCANDECEETLKLVKTCSCIDPNQGPKQAARSVPLCQIIQESGASSAPDSSGSWDAGARATYYHHKLMSTLQVLANKEETVRVQAESLRVAEARIASLTARAQRLRAELDDKAQELRNLQTSTDKCRPEKTDVSLTADAQEVENQKKIVSTLQTNLSVIEELYRECFYESAKQEELIELLRKSYLDVRLTEQEKCDQIGRLQNVINTQRWSLERCQDMAMEVESLKMEISNFLSSSNNDSGMWERSEESLSGEVVEDLQQITAQLLQLRAMLTSDCICGLEGENMRLKDQNETMQIQVGELRQRVTELEAALADKENGDQTQRDEIAEKEQELNSVRQRLAELEESVGDRKGTCEVLAAQLRQAQVSIEDQTRELIEARQRCQGHEATIGQLNEELLKATHIIEEGQALRSEVGELRRALCEGGRRMRALADELARAHDRCHSLDAACREKAGSAAALQAQLEEAHARGAALCDEVRRVVAGVQHWVRRMRAKHREKEIKIKDLEALNRSLQQRNEMGLLELNTEPCCAKCLSLRSKRVSSRATETERGSRGARSKSGHETSCECAAEMAKRRELLMKESASEMGSCTCALRIGERRQDRASTSGSKTVICKCPSQDRYQNENVCNCSSKVEGRRRVNKSSKTSDSEVVSCECTRARKDDRSRTSGSEMASCSSAPTPPRRLLKKKFSPTEEKVTESWWRGGSRRREAGAQQPQRRDAGAGPACARDCQARYLTVSRLPREASPSAELEQRVRALHAALERSQARWAHARAHAHAHSRST